MGHEGPVVYLTLAKTSIKPTTLAIGATIGDTLFCASATVVCHDTVFPGVVTASRNRVSPKRSTLLVVFVPATSSQRATVASCAEGNALTLIETSASLVQPVAVSDIRATYTLPSGTLTCVIVGSAISVPIGGGPSWYQVMVLVAAGSVVTVAFIGCKQNLRSQRPSSRRNFTNNRTKICGGRRNDPVDHNFIICGTGISTRTGQCPP